MVGCCAMIEMSRYAAAALAREIEAVVGAAHSSRNISLNRAAFSLGGLIASGHLPQIEVEQQLNQAAQDAGLDRAESKSTIRSGLRAGMRKPRDIQDRHAAWCGEPKHRPIPTLPPLPPEPEPFDELQPQWAAMWERETKTITADTLGGRYLLSRGCALPHPDGDLREHPASRHPSGHVGPALVGLITDIADVSRRLNLHRTWIAADGSGTKAAVDRPRRLLWRHRKKGGCIRLWPDSEVTLGLGVAEGIETALSLAKTYSPVWSLIDSGNLGAMPYLYPIAHLTVACDHDPAGMRAAAEITCRWTAAAAERLDDPADFSSWALLPRNPGYDANDAPRFEIPGAKPPEFDAEVQIACARLGLSPFGSSARVVEVR